MWRDKQVQCKYTEVWMCVWSDGGSACVYATVKDDVFENGKRWEWCEFQGVFEGV